MASEAKVNTVVRHNTLIEGEYNLTLEELRIWAMIVSEIDKNDTNFKATYRIYPREYIKLSGTKSKSVYADLRSALKRLRDQELRMKIKKNGETGTLVTGFISSVFYNDNNSYFDVSFDPQLKPFLIELKNEFTIMNLDTLFMFSSSYSVRIYELLKQYQKIGTREFKVSELRRILNCTSVYPSYGDFKRRVIAKAQKDMDQSGDLKFEFSEIKKGRSVNKLVFHIWKKSDEKDEINQLSDPEDAEKEEVINHLLVAGIAQNQARRFADKHPAQDIKDCIEQVDNRFKNGKNKGNKAGYLASILSNDVLQTEASIKREKEEQKKRREQQEQEQQAFHHKIVKLKKDYDLDHQTQINTLRANLTTRQKNEFVSYAKNLPDFYRRDLIVNEKINTASSIFESCLHTFISTKLLPEYYRTFEHWLVKKMGIYVKEDRSGRYVQISEQRELFM